MNVPTTVYPGGGTIFRFTLPVAATAARLDVLPFHASGPSDRRCMLRPARLFDGDCAGLEAQRMEVPMKWEYRVEEIDLVAIPDAESLLNDTGGEGWELVSVALSVGGVTSHNIAFFKRPARD